MRIVHQTATPGSSQKSYARLPLPPFTKQWIKQAPSAGIVVAVGSDAWDRAEARSYICIVLPPGCDPSEFRWPTNHRPALILETGSPDDDRLLSLAEALMRAGAPSVVALRESLLDSDPRIFFEVGANHVAA